MRVRNRATSLTVAIGHIQLIADCLEATSASSLAIVYALPVINVSKNALATEVGTINKIVVHQVVTAFAALQEVVQIFSVLIDI